MLGSLLVTSSARAHTHTHTVASCCFQHGEMFHYIPKQFILKCFEFPEKIKRWHVHFHSESVTS